MPLFEKVLYSTDFSPLAELALEFVKKLKEAGAKEVIVVHVVDDLSVELPEGTDLISEKEILEVLPGNDQEYVISIIEKLNLIKKELEKIGLSTKRYLISGSPAKEIVSIANKEYAKLIVMGAHGKGLLTELLLGSVSTDVIRKANCPVLIIKKREE